MLYLTHTGLRAIAVYHIDIHTDGNSRAKIRTRLIRGDSVKDSTIGRECQLIISFPLF